jgi:hypothetical protein
MTVTMNGLVSGTNLVVIACGRAKSAMPRKCSELYTSDTFRHFAVSASALAKSESDFTGRDWAPAVLSAKHGLVGFDHVLDPYDLTMGQPGCVTVDELVDQLIQIGPRTVSAMLPGKYLLPLWHAVSYINTEGSEEDPWIELRDTFEAPYGPTGGIGYQRGKASQLACV